MHISTSTYYSLLSCGPNWPDPSNFSYGLFMFVFGFFIPVSIIVPSNIAVMTTMRRVSNASTS